MIKKHSQLRLKGIVLYLIRHSYKEKTIQHTLDLMVVTECIFSEISKEIIITYTNTSIQHCTREFCQYYKNRKRHEE